MKSLDLLLESLEPITKRVVSYVKAEYKKDGRVFTNFDKESTILGIQFNMVRSFTKYVKEGSTISNVKASMSYNNITCSMIVRQDGEEHILHTDAVLAGGYNIQRLHVRFITNTTLPSKLNNAVMVKAVKAKVKKLGKYKSILKTKENYNKSITKKKEKFEILSRMTKKEIIVDAEWGDFFYKSFEDLEDDHREQISKNTGKPLDTKEQWEAHKEESIWLEFLKPQHESRIKMNVADTNRLHDVVLKFGNEADKIKKELGLTF